MLNQTEHLDYYIRYARLHSKLKFVHGGLQSTEKDILDQVIFMEVMNQAQSQAELHQIEEQARVELERNQAEQRRQKARLRLAGEDRQKGKGSRVIVIPQWVATTAAIAALVILGIGVYGVFFHTSETTTVVETPVEPDEVTPVPAPQPDPIRLQHSFAATWGEGTSLVVGQGVPKEQKFELLEGYVQLMYPNGVKVMLRGPAKFEPISDMLLSVDTGMARCTVVDGAEGFTITTPSGDIVDLGTQFGVEVLEAATKVQVIEGEVRAQREHGAVVRELRIGEAAAMPVDTATIEDSEPRPELYPSSWEQVERGVRAYDKGVRLFSLPSSIEVHKFENDNRIAIFEERSGIVLERDLQVDVQQAGTADRFGGKPVGKIQAGTSIDSYMIHYDPVGSPERPVYTSATFVFDRPILGLIVTNQQLKKSQGMLKAPGLRYPAQGQINVGLEGLEFMKLPEGQKLDYVVLSDDRKSLTVRLVTNKQIDLLRVITEAGTND